MADPKKGKAFDIAALRAKGRQHRWTAIGAGAIALTAALGWYLAPRKDVAESRVAGVTPHLDATPGGREQKESPNYQRSLETANDKAYQDAIKTGRSNIPTVERSTDPLQQPAPTQEKGWKQTLPQDAGPPPPVNLRAPQATLPEPAPRPTAAQAAPAAPPPPPPPKPTMDDAILAQMKELAAAWGPRPALVVDYTPRGAKEGADAAKAAAAAAAGAPAAAKSRATPIITAGTILYGSTLTAVNSDAPGSPVVVTVDAGPYRKSRLIGAFAQPNNNAEALVVRFTLMTLPSGETTPVSAYAVDGATASTAVASDVDRRYLSRYAPVLGAAFVAGFGAAASQVGTTQQQSSSGITVSQLAPSLKQAAFAGASTAAAAIASDVMARAPKGPLVTLAADYPIAILFVDSVYGPGASETEQIAANNAAAAKDQSALAIAQAQAQRMPQQPLVQGYQGQTGLRTYPGLQTYGPSGYGGGLVVAPQVQYAPAAPVIVAPTGVVN